MPEYVVDFTLEQPGWEKRTAFNKHYCVHMLFFLSLNRQYSSKSKFRYSWDLIDKNIFTKALLIKTIQW